MTQISIYLFQIYCSVSFSKRPDPSASSSSSTIELDSILEELLSLEQKVCANSVSECFVVSKVQ